MNHDDLNKLHILTERSLICFGLFLIILPMFASAASGDFKIILQPGERHDIGCKYFDIQLEIQGYGVIPLDQGVCAGWFNYSPDSTNEEREANYKRFEAYQYDAEVARYGVDTGSFNVLVTGDKAWIEWRTVPQGSGLHIEHEYRVYQKEKDKPLVSRNIKAYAKSGWSSRVEEKLAVKAFTQHTIELQIDSNYYQILGSNALLHYWNKNVNGYVANVELRTNVRYGFSANGVVDILDARIFYKQGPKDLKSDVARYFRVDVESLSDQEGNVYEIHLDKDRYEKLFAFVRHDIARSLHELLEEGSIKRN